MLSCVEVNAQIGFTTSTEITYTHFYHGNSWAEFIYKKYLPYPAPEGLTYNTWLTTFANVDSTSDYEDIILITAEIENQGPRRECVQAFLFIDGADLFKIYDKGTHQLDVKAKTIELHRAPFDLNLKTEVSFRLADITDDGILDIWVETTEGVALISFQEGEFKEVLSDYAVTKVKLNEAFEVEFRYLEFPFEPIGQQYHPLLTVPAPKKTFYNTTKIATANVDNTPEKENIVLITVQTGIDGPCGEWVQAFLLITDSQTDKPKKIDLFALFNTQTYQLDIPDAKTVEVKNPPYIYRSLWKGKPWGYYSITFKLIDLTGDGILDIWLDHGYGMAVISFVNGEFKEVCSAYVSSKREHPMEYVDIDKDGIYELKIHDRISTNGIPTAAYPMWTNFYEWDGNTYVYSNKKYYGNDDELLNELLGQYNFWERFSNIQEYHFYIGLVYYFRNEAPKAHEHLQWVIENAQKDDYKQAAASILKKLQLKDDTE